MSLSIRTAFAAVILLFPLPTFARDVTAGSLVVRSPWTRPTPPGAPAAAGYMTIANRGRAADRLLSASSPAVDRVEVHEMKLDGGIMRMRALPRGLAVPASGTAELKPGGFHLMLIGPKQVFAVGGKVPVTLRFERAGSVKVDLDVRTARPEVAR